MDASHAAPELSAPPSDPSEEQTNTCQSTVDVKTVDVDKNADVDKTVEMTAQLKALTTTIVGTGGGGNHPERVVNGVFGKRLHVSSRAHC
jgi:hypothetical protein